MIVLSDGFSLLLGNGQKSFFCVKRLKLDAHEQLYFPQKIVKLVDLLNNRPFLHGGKEWILHLCESIDNFALVVWIKRALRFGNTRGDIPWLLTLKVSWQDGLL